ncbi:uncharacterized protein LOC124412514 isoform X2 [Diprion similis]|uniref:uncharacterized protein LOC124412514 isoform X2 n=1 Tax=Diprion similis TaxID=362088 RepID=UPI001EF85668|nr:uncharacterized protein LOC124412514 isoform X2 [Diprion similis]
MYYSILDLPTELLTKILRYFNERDRVAFGCTCRRLDNFMFGDAKLERDLDFSKNGWQTEPRHLQYYFSNVINCAQLRKINIANAICIKAGEMLDTTIGKAVNLVDVNIHGTKFDTVLQLSSFLKCVIHVKRLAIDWPNDDKGSFRNCVNLLSEPFSKLHYLSLCVLAYNRNCLPLISYCDELEELRVNSMEPPGGPVIRMRWRQVSNKLTKIKIVQVRGWDALGSIKDYILSMLPDSRQWTDFEQIYMRRANGFYLEKDVDVHENLLARHVTRRYRDSWYKYYYAIGWTVIAESLLPSVVSLTHVDAPKRYCCLHRYRVGLNLPEGTCLLKPEEAKRLLENPEYQISFLLLRHTIELDCDAHLLLSAFPSVTQLVLWHVVKLPVEMKRKKYWRRRLAKRGKEEFRQRDVLMKDTDSSFKLLIENTPNVQDITFHAYISRNDTRVALWDLDALFLFPNWKKLTTLRLAYIPIQDATALIYIGEHCPNLETIVLNCLGWAQSCIFTKQLAEMLIHCRKLKNFSWEQNWITELYDVFSSLALNGHIENIRVIHGRGQSNTSRLAASIENLIRTCTQLHTFKSVSYATAKRDNDKLIALLRRLKKEVMRPFQFQVVDPSYHKSYRPETIDIVHYDRPNSPFSEELNWMYFTPKTTVKHEGSESENL